MGNEERDDAAVFDLGDGTAVISTTDFFMPIVDDPFDFGRIAATNAISDVWAMGGEPLLAIAILGWPQATLPPEIAARVLDGGRAACAEAGIPLAGGHSIDNPEPLFGLAVTGRVDKAHLKRNSGGRPGDVLLLTKPIGLGVLTTAIKQERATPEHAALARDVMVQSNRFGAAMGRVPGVHAMTDVTGFGLLGHLLEICHASAVSARLCFADVPRLIPDAVDAYIAAGAVPGGTGRNHASYGDEISPLTDLQRAILCDPQTSGGLLLAVDPSAVAGIVRSAADEGIALRPFGTLHEPTCPRITVT